MEDWGYNELIDAVYETYAEYLERGMGPKEAYVRAGAEFDNLGMVENIIADAVIGKIIIGLGEGLEGTISGIGKRLETFEILSARDELSVAELEDLQRRIQIVLDGFKTVTVDYSNRV